MYVHKPKDTDKHEHFIKHLVYILTVTSRRPPSPFLLQRRLNRVLPCSQPQPPLGAPHADATTSSLSSPRPSPYRRC
ncbi:hypothetical protein BHE74_00036424 [Ensete ventricosum]|nr:hypothetical protein BHE74_00036424 [Ensete ventricosum]